MRRTPLTLARKLSASEEKAQGLEAKAALHQAELDTAVEKAKSEVHLLYVPKMEAQFLKGASFASKVASGGIFEYSQASSSFDGTPT